MHVTLQICKSAMLPSCIATLHFLFLAYFTRPMFPKVVLFDNVRFCCFRTMLDWGFTGSRMVAGRYNNWRHSSRPQASHSKVWNGVRHGASGNRYVFALISLDSADQMQAFVNLSGRCVANTTQIQTRSTRGKWVWKVLSNPKVSPMSFVKSIVAPTAIDIFSLSQWARVTLLVQVATLF